MNTKKKKSFFVGDGSATLGGGGGGGGGGAGGGSGGSSPTESQQDVTRAGVKHAHPHHHVSPHVPADRDSLLHNVSSLPETTFQGLANLGGIILFSATAQLIIYNFNHRGFLVDVAPLRCIAEDAVVGFAVYAALCALSYAVFVAQLAYAKNCISHLALMGVYVLVQTLIATVNVRTAFVSRLSPLASMVLTLFVLVLHLKLHSYVFTNTVLQRLSTQKHTRSQSENLRRLLRRNSSGSFTSPDGAPLDDDAVDQERLDAYPDNMTLRDFMYFLCVPSLVYEPRFPRRSSVRVLYALKELVAFLLCALCIYVLGMQYIIPALRDDTALYTRQVQQLKGEQPVMVDSDEANVTITLSSAYLTHTVKLLAKSVFEVLHLSVPSIVMWLTGFYALFHCWLNFLSEITCYADREFYRDWWNAATLDEFWRKWNLMTHEWLHRHIFLESLRYGRSKIRATLLTFLVSAVLHEYLFTLSFKSVEIFFAVAMVVQVPLILLSRVVHNQRWGNVLMWLSLFTGQPMLELLYMRQYALEHPGCLDFAAGQCAPADGASAIARVVAAFTPTGVQ